MLPEKFLERMKGMIPNEWEAFVASYDQEKYQALRLNALKVNLDGETAASMGEEASFAKLRKVPWAENGYYYSAADQPGKHPFHDAGVYYIQEPSAMAPVELLDVCPGERVLDLCAAPGGKSTQIAAKLQGEGFLLCNEIHPARAKILSENVERMGIQNACVTNETPAKLAAFFPGFFDKILVDAPCSGEGMFRKNDVACEEWSPENVELCARRQDEILDCAANMLRPGGKLVFSTCTFAPEENEGSIWRFLDRHTDFAVMEIDKSPFGEGCDGVPAFVGGEDSLCHTLRLWPHKVQGEGHFAALLTKAGEAGAYRAPAASGILKTVSEKELGEYRMFVKETFLPGKAPEGAYFTFGENLYLAPEGMPSLKGLKVMRPGLHIGEMKKNRFEPSHALAMAMEPSAVKHVWNMKADDERVRAYLSGQTFPAEGEKGWYLICVDSYSIGWGKLAGGVMKNHYPKGLRH